MDIKKLKSKKIITLVIIFICLLIIALTIFTVVIPNYKYNKAIEYISQGDYEEAYNILLEIKGLKKSEELLNKFEHKLVKTVDPNNLSFESKDIYEAYEYDSKGNCILKTAMIPNTDYGGVIEQKTKYIYNDKNKCIKEIISGEFFWPPKEYEDVTEYIYDKAGNKMKKIHYENDNIDNVTLYEYENNLPVKERHYSSVFGEDYLTEYFYNDSGKLVKEQKSICIPQTGIEKSNISLYYNEIGEINKKISTDNIGKTVTTTYQYEYDEQNRKTKQLEKHSNGLYTYEYIYDCFGNLIKESCLYTPNDTNLADESHSEITVYEYKLFYFPDKVSDVIDTPHTSSAETKPSITKEDVSNAYREIVSEYKTALTISNEAFNSLYPDTEEKYNINTYMLSWIRNGDEPKLNYALYDIDYNGIDELIIADGSFIIDIFSISGNKAVKLIEGYERSRIDISDLGAIFTSGSNGYASGGCSKYYIEEDDKGNISLVELGYKEYDVEAEFYEYSENKNLVSYDYYCEATNMFDKFEFDDKVDWQIIN